MWLGDYLINTTWFLTTLGTFFWLLLFLTLAPRDYVTYCQARGLSGHTSPCGECTFFSSRGYTRGLAACSVGLLLFFYFGPWHHVTTSPTIRLGDKVGTLHLVVNVLSLFGPRPGTGCLLGWFSIFLLVFEPSTTRLHHLLSGSGTKWAHFTLR